MTDPEVRELALEALATTDYVWGVLPIIQDRQKMKIKELIIGSVTDDETRGWIHALDWIIGMKHRLREERKRQRKHPMQEIKKTL